MVNKRILEAEAADTLDDADGVEHGVHTYGTLIAWDSADQLFLSALGVLHVSLTLVLMSGKVISDSTFPILLRFQY
jgi:melanoma-associated antigen